MAYRCRIAYSGVYIRKRDLYMNKKELELYVHIPFCVRKCAYCDFLSFPSGEHERASYVDALLEEIKEQKDNFKDYFVTTVFLGGGTPSLLREDDTARIFDALWENFDISRSAEITLEVNPGTVTGKKAAVWKACGMNRLSIGLQSVNDGELKMLGRIHTFKEFLDTWRIVREKGFDNINIDLISAIPGQTVQSWEKTLRTIAELGAEHISAYSLIIEEGTSFYRLYGEVHNSDGETPASCAEKNGGASGIPPLPGEDAEREIYKSTGRILKEYGYHRYEISNYAKEGYECRHNFGYWERKEYLGLGLGASSLISEHRFHNTENMERYLQIFGKHSVLAGSGSRATSPRTFPAGGNGANPQMLPTGAAAEDVEALSVSEQMEESIFLGLRKTEGISCREFREKFGQTLDEVYGEQIRRFEKLGLMEREKDRLRLTERGIDVSNSIFVEFML